MWGGSGRHSYTGERESWVLLRKLVKNNGGLGSSNQNVLQVAQRRPNLYYIYVSVPLFYLPDPSESQ